MDLEEMKTMIDSWRWDLVFHSIHSVGYSLDGETWRMTKGEVVSMALERASNGNVRNADRRGFDLTTREGVRIEVKSQKQIFLKDWRGQPRDILKNQIQLKNTRGKRQQQNWKQTFDYLLLVQTVPPFIASIVPWEVVNDNVEMAGDQIKIERLKEEQMTFVTPKNGFDVDFEIPVRENREDAIARMRRREGLPGFNLRRMLITQIRRFIDEVEQISKLESDKS